MSESVQTTMNPAYGYWPGRVVDTKDPTKTGRVRVRVDQVYGKTTEPDSNYIADDMLPWARGDFDGAGPGSGDYWVPPVGSPVWVSFWGGDKTKPIWHGGWGVPNLMPTEFTGAYAPTPQARVIKTEGKQLLQFRWKKGEERFEVLMPSGTHLLVDDTTATGPRVLVQLPSGRKVVLDDKLKRISASDPQAQSIVMDGNAVKITATTPGEMDVTTGGNVVATVGGNLMATVTGFVSVLCAALTANASGAVNLIAGAAANVTATGLLTLQALGITQTSTGVAPTTTTGGGLDTRTFLGAAVWTYLSWALNAAALIALTAATGMTLTATAGILALVGANITLGQALATKYRLLDERFITGAGGYNSHSHGGVPIDTPIAPIDIPNFATTDTKAS